MPRCALYKGRPWAILARAERSGDLRTAFSAIREARGNLELLAELLGRLNANVGPVRIEVVYRDELETDAR